MRYFHILLTISVFVFFPRSGDAQLLTGFEESTSSPKPIEETVKPFPDGRVPDLPVSPVEVQSSVQPSPSPMTLTGFDGRNPIGSAAAEGGSGDKAPVDFEADNLSYDETGEEVIASGDVIIVQEGRILRADEVRYNIAQDTVKARGNVVLNEVNGDIHFSQDVEFNDKLKNGFVDGLKSYLADGSRFTAEAGRREDGLRTIMEDATYTPCEPCKANPEKAPAWRIRSAEVTHHKDDARVSYKHARFEIYGIPVAYTPYFSHPDGTIKRKSGFLAPSLGYKSDWGAFVENSYYWDIAPDKDATFGLVAMTDQAPLGLLEYRQRWDKAYLILDGGATYADRTDEIGEDDYTVDEEFRGHIFAEGLWEMNEKWRSGVDIEYVSDDQYARQYDVSSKNVLETRLYAERFSGRNYALVNARNFKDIRISELEDDQPEILPEITADFIGEPGAIPWFKGRWDASFSMLNLMRDGSGQDVNRLSTNLGWERRMVSDYGLVSDIDMSLRGDAYYVNDRSVATVASGRSRDATATRFYPQLHMQSRYPVAKMFEESQVMFEPILALTVAPEIDSNSDIPNEDSRDVQLDASNLFEPNRFSGLDAVEDESRVTYGMRGGWYGHSGSYLETFLGQSYRFDEDNTNPFNAGSGLNDQDSDIVGYINSRIGNKYTLGYRFQLDNEKLASSRHELDAEADWNRFRLGGNYLFAKALAGTEITEDREQIQGRASYYLTDQWQVWNSTKYDLGARPGLRKARVGLDYFGQCVSWSLIGARNYTDDATGESDTEILFRIGLKNLGEFARSGLRDEGAWE